MDWILLCVIFSILPALFWFWFLIFSKKEIRTVSLKSLAEVFGGGFFLATVAMLIEKNLAKIIPLDYLSNIREPFFIINPRALIFIFILTFILIAPLEELLKYFFLKKEIYRKKEIDLVIEGVQLGIVLSLGFATLENGFYFYQAASYEILGGLFVLRFFLSTLAHVLYGGMLGYYLTLSKFHKLYSNFFLRRGLITVIVLHGFFNFFLLTQAFYYAVGMVILVFVFLIKWIIDRRDFESFVLKKKAPVSTPLFARKEEVDAFLMKGDFRFSEIKALSFCPRCLSIKKIGDKKCPYCGMKFD